MRGIRKQPAGRKGAVQGSPGVTIGLRIEKKTYAIENCNPCNNGEAVDIHLNHNTHLLNHNLYNNLDLFRTKWGMELWLVDGKMKSRGWWGPATWGFGLK